MISQIVASFSRIKTSRKGEGLALNHTKDRENEVFWENQNVDQLKKPFAMPTSAARKTNYLAYLLSDVRVIHL